MSDSRPNSINAIAEFESRPVDACVAYVLLWVVVNADDVSKVNGNTTLKKCLASLTLEQKTLRELLSLAKQQQESDLVQVLELLNKELSAEEKAFLLQMAVTVASFSDSISNCGNHILRFLADLLTLGQAHLADVYHQETQRTFPEPDDLSSQSWWFSAENRNCSLNDGATLYQRREALEILGLDEKATAAEIKHTYRRLVQLFHPDRHGREDQDSLEAAEAEFLRVQRAYEVLRQ